MTDSRLRGLTEQANSAVSERGQPADLGDGDERKDGGTLKTADSPTSLRSDYGPHRDATLGVLLCLGFCIAFWSALVYVLTIVVT